MKLTKTVNVPDVEVAVWYKRSDGVHSKKFEMIPASEFQGATFFGDPTYEPNIRLRNGRILQLCPHGSDDDINEIVYEDWEKYDMME
jgi:hypothetical protein